MARDRDTLPATTIKDVKPSPASPCPTTAALKAEIDSGRTGDKNPAHDPGLSPLGTDDEAAGAPPSSFRIALARKAEVVQRWTARGTPASNNQSDGFPRLFVGLIIAIGAIILAGVLAVR
jgi:hypothetical protein